MEFPLDVRRTAHVATLGGPSDELSAVWYVLHGYGQRAEVFLRSFAPIAGPERWIVAPEGLSRFYLSGVTGSIGASWMTSAHREEEIADYVAYLDQLHAEVEERLEGRRVPVHVLGFSQGTATASRWVQRGSVRPSTVTLWAGAAAKELDLAELGARRPATRWNFVVGDEDEWLAKERVEYEEQRLEAAGLDFRLTLFRGGHHIDRVALEELARETP